MRDYFKLQNGSDIRGVSMEGVEGQDVNLTVNEAQHIAAGFARWLKDDRGMDGVLTVSIGRDPRVTGEMLLGGLEKGFGGAGARVLDCGPASTPAMFMSTLFEDFRCDGAIMITASHLPFNRNGFKFFTKDGGLDKNDIKKILQYAVEDEEKGAEGAAGNVGKADLMAAYCSHLRSLIVKGCGGDEEPLSGMKITVDAGNGGGGFFATDVLAPLGADISSSQFLEPDGMFPNHVPNPENAGAMASISDKVKAAGTDLGIIFDTDVDRSAAVDENGREISRNGIVAMAAALIGEEHPGATVVTDSITSRQLTEFIEGRLGLKHFRYRRGYRNVINKAIEMNGEGADCQLAIETSGHAALKENYFLDDGAYLAVKIVIKAALLKKEGKMISSMLEDLQEPLDETEVRIPVKCDDFQSYADRVLEDLKSYAAGAEGLSLEEPNYEGVRINFEEADGWCLLRKSLHDPIMPLNMSSDREGGCSLIAERMKAFLADYEDLDLEGM